MTTPKNLLAISGSTRKLSTNQRFIEAIRQLSDPLFTLKVFDGIEHLPHFNPDHNDPAPEPVISFRKLLSEADAVIICTPEYAHGVPGSLKNAIDWTVSSNDFYQKPTALVTASTDGSHAHQSLIETLHIIEAKDIRENQLLVQFAATKVNAAGEITDLLTKNQVEQLLQRLHNSIEK